VSTILLFLLAAPVWLLTAFFAVQVMAGLRRDPAGELPATGALDAVIVVPACNEGALISDTVKRLKKAGGEKMRLVVVADNCSDQTAELARLAGAQVIERNDPARRGKGYALAFAVEALRSAAPSVLIVVDADCSIEAPSLERLARTASATNRPCQSVNLLRAVPQAPPMVQISSFAFLLKNLVRQRGLQRLSGRVHLTGTGMAIPFRLLPRAVLASANIVEDLSLGLDLAQQGFPPMLTPDALVLSSPASQDDTLVQRRRWEGGFLATSFRRAPKLALDGLRCGDYGAFLAGIDLMVPPLALLMTANVAILGFALLAALSGLGRAPLAFGFSSLALAAGAVILAWQREGRAYLAGSVFLRIPLYLAWKIPLYLSLGRRGAPREWLRTRR